MTPKEAVVAKFNVLFRRVDPSTKEFLKYLGRTQRRATCYSAVCAENCGLVLTHAIVAVIHLTRSAG